LNMSPLSRRWAIIPLGLHWSMSQDSAGTKLTRFVVAHLDLYFSPEEEEHLSPRHWVPVADPAGRDGHKSELPGGREA
jgi:hypothetical protein